MASEMKNVQSCTVTPGPPGAQRRDRDDPVSLRPVYTNTDAVHTSDTVLDKMRANAMRIRNDRRRTHQHADRRRESYRNGETGRALEPKPCKKCRSRLHLTRNCRVPWCASCGVHAYGHSETTACNWCHVHTHTTGECRSKSCVACLEVGHTADACPSDPDPHFDVSAYRCPRCGKTAHLARDCRAQTLAVSKAQTESRNEERLRAQRLGLEYCEWCHAYGHLACDCAGLEDNRCSACGVRGHTRTRCIATETLHVMEDIRAMLVDRFDTEC